MPTDFSGVFTQLREILKKHADGLVVVSDTPTDYTVSSPAIGPNKKPLWFGCVLSKKSAVTYHLMPLYFNPKLNATIPPELLARKQGKTCFNFQRPDPDLFAKIDALTATARQQWERRGFLSPGQISMEQMANAARAAGADLDSLSPHRKTKGKQAKTRSKTPRGKTKTTARK